MSSQSYLAFRAAMEAAANGRGTDISARLVHARACRSRYMAAGLRGLIARLGRVIEAARRAAARRRLRRETIAQLEMLDDRALEDIGIRRDMIAEVAETLSRKALAPAAPARPAPARPRPRVPANDDAPRRAA